MRKMFFLAAVVVLLALVPVALAGGWATITIDEMPGQLRAGEPWSIDFTVLQHGQTPVHDLGPNIPVEPTFVATNAATGEEVVAVARPDKEVGRFTLEVTLPSEGEWAWTIYPAPLAGEVQYEPLTVLPAAPVVDAGPASARGVAGRRLPISLGIGALAVALGLVPWLFARNRQGQQQQVSVEESGH